MAVSMGDLQEMLQHELNRFQTNPSDVRIDPDASITGDSFNHSRAHELCYGDNLLGSPQPLISRTAGGSKRCRATRKGKTSKSQQCSSHVRSSCADEIIAAALGDGTNKRTSKSPDPRQNISRLRNNHSGLNTESLGPAPIHFDPSRDCANLLAEWGVPDSQPPSHGPKGAENASAQLNSIERMLDDSVAEREHVAHKQEHEAQMQRLRAIEQDWSTINDMRQDFESTKAKLKTLMHRELVPQTETMPSTSRAPHVDRTVHAYNPTCAAVGNPQAYTQHHQPGVADSGLSIDTDELEGSRRVNDGHRMAGTVSEECSKPYSQWHRYEQRLRAREAEAEAAELRSEVETLKQRMKSQEEKNSSGQEDVSATRASSHMKGRRPVSGTKTLGQGTSTEMDALFSAVDETRSTMLDTLRRVQWSPQATRAVTDLEERLHSQCVHGAAVDARCRTAAASDPLQLSHAMMEQARELLETLVQHVEASHHGTSSDPGLALPSDVQALQDHLAEMTREYGQMRDNLAAERCMRREVEKALTTAAADAAAANTAPVQGLLDALHAARAEATETKKSNRELRQQLSALGHDGDTTALRGSQSMSPHVHADAVGRGLSGSTTGGAAAEAEIAARDEALADAVQEAAELRRQLRAASAARGEVECLEREIAGLTREVELGAAAQRDVKRLEREVGDLQWQLERSTEELQKQQQGGEASRSASGDATLDGSRKGDSVKELKERLNVAEMALEKELAAKNRLEKEVDRWKSSDGKEIERLRTEMASLEQVKEDSVLELRRLELRHADTAAQLEDALAGKHPQHGMHRTSGRHSGPSDRSAHDSPGEREASLWGGLGPGPAHSDMHVHNEAALSVSVDGGRGVVGVEGAERQVQRVERELAHAKARVRELRSREQSQRDSAAGGGVGSSTEWGALLESPGGDRKGRNVLLEGSSREASEAAGGDGAQSSSALRDLEARVTRLEKERAVATAQLDLARSLRGNTSGRQHSTAGESMHSSGRQAADGGPGPLDAFVRIGPESGASEETGSAAAAGVWELAGTLSQLEEEIQAALGNRDEGGASGGHDVQQRLRSLASSVHKRLLSAGSRVRDAKSAAATSDAHASALAARLRLAGMSDEVAGLPPLAHDGITSSGKSTDGAPLSVEVLRAALADAQREVTHLQTALHDALQRVEVQAAELASLRGAAAAGAVGAVGAAAGATSPETSAGSTPLISAWSPGQAGAAGAEHGAHSPRSVSADPDPPYNSPLGSAGDSRAESSLRTGATVAGIIVPGGSGQLLEATQRLGSLASGVPGRPSDPGADARGSMASGGLSGQKSSLHGKAGMGQDLNSGAAGSPQGSQTHSRLLDSLLDVSNEGARARSVSSGRSAGQGKQTFMGVDLSDIDGSSVGAPEGDQPNTRQSSPIRNQLPGWGSKKASEEHGEHAHSGMLGEVGTPRSGDGDSPFSAQAPQASSGAPNGYNPLLDDSDREAAASRAERTAHGQDQPSHDLDGSESNHSNIFSLAAAHERAAAAHGASDGSLSSAVDQQHQHQLHKNATTSQQPTPAPQHDSPGQQRTQDPFEAHTGAHMHSRDRGGELAREGEESSRTAEEASISHMASRDGRAHAPEAQTHDASAGRRSGLGDLDSGDALRPGSSHASHLHGSGTHAPAANGCTASLSSDVRSDVDHCNGLGWAGDSAGGLNGTGNMRHASSMEQLAQLADDYEGRNSVQGSTSRAGGDARLDLSAFGPDAASRAADGAAADEDPITAMTRRSLRKLEQHEAEDERRRSLSPLHGRGRSSTKSTIGPHASAPHGALSARSLSPGAASPPPFAVPTARATSPSPPLSPFALTPPNPPASASQSSSRTGDWVAVSSRYTHAGTMHDGSQPMHGLSRDHAENDADNIGTRAQHSSHARSRSPVLRDVTDDVRAGSQVPALPPFAISSDTPERDPHSAASRGVGAFGARGSMQQTPHSPDLEGSPAAPPLRPLSSRLPGTAHHTGLPRGAASEDGGVATKRAATGSSAAAAGGAAAAAAAENPLEKLRQRLEAWRSAPIPVAGRDSDTPMSPPQFPPARSSSRSWSASEQLGRPPTGRGSTAGTAPSGLAASHSHRGPFSGVLGDDVGNGDATKVPPGNLLVPSTDVSSADGALSRAPEDTERSEADRKVLEGSGAPLSAWHASQDRVLCPDADAGDEKAEERSNRWQKIPQLLTKYGGPGRMVGHSEVFSDDGEPEERGAPALRPGAHSPTAGIRHMTATVLQLEDARVAAASAAAAADAADSTQTGPPARGARMSMSVPGGGAWGNTWMDRELDDAQPVGGGSWASMGGFESDVGARARKSTPTADLARRLAEVRAGSRR